MKILFIQPTLSMTTRYGDLEQAGGIEPPFGICYLAAILRKEHYEISIIDAQALGIGIDETVEQVIDFEPDIVGITATTPAIFVANHLSKKIKEKLPDILCIYSSEPRDIILMKTEFNEAMHFSSLVPFILDFDGKEERAVVGYYTGVILLNDFIDKYAGGLK